MGQVRAHDDGGAVGRPTGETPATRRQRARDVEAERAGEAAAFDERAERAGHGRRLVAGGKFDAGDLVRTECACGGYRSPHGLEPAVTRFWRQHAEARIAEGIEP